MRWKNKRPNSNEAYEPTTVEHLANIATHGVSRAYSGRYRVGTSLSRHLYFSPPPSAASHWSCPGSRICWPRPPPPKSGGQQSSTDALSWGKSSASFSNRFFFYFSLYRLHIFPAADCSLPQLCFTSSLSRGEAGLKKKERKMCAAVEEDHFSSPPPLFSATCVNYSIAATGP